MKTIEIPRIVIAGTNSGVGKTTIVAGIVAALTKAGKKVQACKVGPDYIDPGFHALASGRDCYNLDTWLVPQEKLEPFFVDIAGDADIAVIEGVMGLYDGGREGVSSTAEIAKKLKAPVLLVIDCKAMADSAAAIALGFKSYDPDINFAGVILNRLGSDNHEHMIRKAMDKLGIPVVGAIRRDDRMQSPERHLGLTPVTEIDPVETLKAICEVMEKMVDLDELQRLAKSAPALQAGGLMAWIGAKAAGESSANAAGTASGSAGDASGAAGASGIAGAAASKAVTIGIAMDEAFSFYYPASLKTLEAYGAKLVYFSPLRDERLPEADGYFFGGGFPEMFLEDLRKNESMRASIKEAAAAGKAIYAECGGLMYLCESVVFFDGTEAPMVGLVPAKAVMQEKLQRVGYVTATAEQDTLLATKGASLKGHEFHFSTMEPTVDEFPWAFHLEGGRKNQSYLGGYAKGKILASYLHLNFAGNEEAAQRFIALCRA